MSAEAVMFIFAGKSHPAVLRFLLSRIAYRINNELGYAWVSQETLAAELGVHVRTVQRLQQQAIKAGWLSVTSRNRGKQGGFVTNHLWLPGFREWLKAGMPPRLPEGLRCPMGENGQTSPDDNGGPTAVRQRGASRRTTTGVLLKENLKEDLKYIYIASFRVRLQNPLTGAPVDKSGILGHDHMMSMCVSREKILSRIRKEGTEVVVSENHTTGTDSVCGQAVEKLGTVEPPLQQLGDASNPSSSTLMSCPEMKNSLPRAKTPPASPASSSGDDELFEKFWTVWPRKEGKKPARKRWDKLKAETKKRLPEAATAYILAKKKASRGQDFRMFVHAPYNWIREGLYEDYLKELPRAPQGKQSIAGNGAETQMELHLQDNKKPENTEFPFYLMPDDQRKTYGDRPFDPKYGLKYALADSDLREFLENYLVMCYRAPRTNITEWFLRWAGVRNYAELHELLPESLRSAALRRAGISRYPF